MPGKDTEKMDISPKKLSDIILEELKGIAADGKKLSSTALAARLSKRTEFKELMDGPQDTRDVPLSASETDRLKKQVETSREQREKLLKQLTRIEEAEDVYRRGLLAVIELLPADENASLNDSVGSLKEGLKGGGDIADIEAAITRIKNVAIHDESAKSPERAGFFDKFLKRAPSGSESETGAADTLDRLKDAYRAIIDELKLNLDQDSFKKLAEIEGEIYTVGSPDDFLPIRKEIIMLIQDYISRVSGEREEAAAFIREIGERLIEVETHILDTLPGARETHQENSAFNTLLEEKIGELRQRVDFSKTLAELKQTVVSSLSSIQKAIKDKRGKDETRMAEVEKRMGRLQQDLGRMKNEIATERQRADILEREVLIDPLTGVYNRRAYGKRINEELQRYLRHKRPFSVLLLDVDRFKTINDRYGHAVGDLCLKEIIKRIQPLLRESDFLARFGGEEFILLLPETVQSGAVEVAEKLRKCIEKTEFIHRGKPVPITISIGATQVTSADQQTDKLFTRVDKAMYRAKAAGRNCVVEA